MKSTGDNPTSTWLTLPLEMRMQVYNNLPQNDAFNLRLSCKQMQEEIDEHFLLEIKIDDYKEPNILKTIQNRRIRSVHVLFLQNPPETLPIFTYPQYIETLDIDLKEHKISSQILHQILLESSKYLKTIKYTLRKARDQNYPQSESPFISYHYNYKSLKVLKICAWQVILGWNDPESFSKHFSNNNYFVKILKDVALSSCHLSTIDVRLGVIFHHYLYVNAVSVALFTLISKNFNTLSVLRIKSAYFYCLPEEQSDSDVKNFDSGLLNKVTNLREIDFDVMKCENILITQLFKILLGAQKNLEILKFASTSRTPDVFNIGEVVLKNSGSLRYISLVIKAESNTKYVDFSLFKDCRKLKTLEVKDFSEESVACNLHLLPKSIEVLAFEGVSILSEEMGNDFSKVLPSLEMVLIYNCQKFQSMREIFEFLKMISTLPHILAVHMRLRSRQCWTNFSKVTKLLGVKWNLEENYHMRYFYLRKMNSEVD